MPTLVTHRYGSPDSPNCKGSGKPAEPGTYALCDGPKGICPVCGALVPVREYQTSQTVEETHDPEALVGKEAVNAR